MNKKNNLTEFYTQKINTFKVIMDCRTTSAHEFRTKLRFMQYVILTKDQSKLTKIMNSFEGIWKHNIVC